MNIYNPVYIQPFLLFIIISLLYLYAFMHLFKPSAAEQREGISTRQQCAVRGPAWAGS